MVRGAGFCRVSKCARQPAPHRGEIRPDRPASGSFAAGRTAAHDLFVVVPRLRFSLAALRVIP